MLVENLIPLVGALLAAVCLGFSVRAGRRQRLIDDVPTSTTTGVFIGLVELKGTAEAEQPVWSYLAEVPCVYYRWHVAEHWSRTERYTGSNGKRRTRRRSGWKRVADGGDQIRFYLRDEDGVIRVDPQGAEIEPEEVLSYTCGRWDPMYYDKGPAFAVSDSDHRRRFVEEAIRLHAPVYVMGPAREREDAVAPEIRYDDDEALFLISTKTEEKIRSGYGWQFWGLGVLALVLATAGAVIRDAALERPQAEHVPVYVGVVAAAAGVWLLGGIWMVYNSVVGLRQRVRQAWANVDVQLKRRADLIPNLVRAVEGLRDHERRVHAELAELRRQMTATAPGEAGDDPHGLLPQLRIVVEMYPELTADESFLRLQRSLADTEHRIALARAYFNDIATFYNTRLEIVPDRWVARLARLRPQPLITAMDFEREAVRVSLAEANTPVRVEVVQEA